MKTLLLIFFLFLTFQSIGQKAIRVAHADEVMNIDGYLDESVWDKYSYADSFYQYFPVDSTQAVYQSEVRMVFDEKHLYISVVCHSAGDDYTTPTLKRDYRAGGNDNITFLIDPIGNGNNAYMFGTNPLGIKREGLLTQGGTSLNGFSTSWDQKWYAAASIQENKWVAELKIPFKILQFDEINDTWKFNVYRFDMQENERTTWVRIPSSQFIFNLSFMGDMTFDRPLKSKSSNTVIIPYVTSSVVKDNEAIDTDYKLKANAGGDIKMNVGTGLKLDLTLNPDFSQVEVDRQITNLDRFELFFPERRQFFIENNDLFSNHGFREVNPFFSRRIGIVEDPSTGFNVQNTIYGGARISGSLNEQWRVGLMTMQTAGDEQLEVASSNFTVASIQRSIFKKSNLSFIAVNKQNFWEESSNNQPVFNRIIGSDLNFATESNAWSGKLFAHYSINENQLKQPFATGLFTERIMENARFRWKHVYIGEGYEAQTGFVRRNDIAQFTPSFDYLFKSATSYVNQHGPSVTFNSIWKPFVRQTDQKFSLNYQVQTIYNYRFNAGLHREIVFLSDAFDPTGTDAPTLAPNSLHIFSYFTVQFRSDSSRPYSYVIRPTFGRYYNGARFGVNGNLRFFRQPYVDIRLNYNYNYFDLPHTANVIQTLLIGPRIDLTFSKSFFLTTFIQYNSQSKNTNINARLQWRFAPVSDLFVVYTDNYFTDPTDPASRFIGDLRNRSLVVKASYWFGL